METPEKHRPDRFVLAYPLDASLGQDGNRAARRTENLREISRGPSGSAYVFSRESSPERIAGPRGRPAAVSLPEKTEGLDRSDRADGGSSGRRRAFARDSAERPGDEGIVASRARERHPFVEEIDARPDKGRRSADRFADRG
ncbi:hypothetical protein KM043_003032 [Ampulex compressa]|nr:hypothetical protein KM043_003032 [Ampulex compressa]